jgi:hypothetical protein
MRQVRHPRRLVAAVALAVVAAAPLAPRAEAAAGPAPAGEVAPAAAPPREGDAPAAVARRWRLDAVTLGFADDFLGVPRTRLNDDNGFVADLRVVAELSDGDRRNARVVASEQLITERGGLRRVDDGKLYVESLRHPGGLRGVTVGWLAGIDVIGDLGGSGLQNWAHQTIFTGRVLDGIGARQLQDRYPGRTEVLGLIGGSVRGVHPLTGPFSLRGGADAAVGAGTGVFAELHPYVALGVSLGFVDLELREGAGTYWTTIRALTMPGGYVTQLFQSQPSARLAINGPRWLPVLLGAELDWNSGNTRQHVGGVVVGARF